MKYPVCHADISLYTLIFNGIVILCVFSPKQINILPTSEVVYRNFHSVNISRAVNPTLNSIIPSNVVVETIRTFQNYYCLYVIEIFIQSLQIAPLSGKTVKLLRFF